MSITATIETNKGKICLNLYADETPVTVANFVNLAVRGYYDGLSFHGLWAMIKWTHSAPEPEAQATDLKTSSYPPYDTTDLGSCPWLMLVRALMAASFLLPCANSTPRRQPLGVRIRGQ